MFYIGTALWALLFFTPAFANTRWPWELNPFDSRIMSAWFAGVAVWSITMYFMKDWVEVKMGIRAILLFLVGLLVVWLVGAFRYGYDHTTIAGKQSLVYLLALVVLLAWLSYSYWRQEQARKKIATIVWTLR